MTMASSTVLCSQGQQTALASATPSPTASATPSLTVIPTASANQTGGGGPDPTLIGAAIVGIIAVALMVGIYYATRRI